MITNKLFIFCILIILQLSIGCINNQESVGLDNEPVGKPNFLVIVADDAGYSDLSFFGGEIQTPALSSLAEKGTVFPNFYNFSRCSPSRASLMTGLYPQKVGVGELSGPNFEKNRPGYLGYLSLRYKTIAEILKEHGYRTMISGKWHLGNRSKIEKTPLGRGFDDFFGLNNGENTHFNPCLVPTPYFVQDKEFTDCDDSFYSSNAFTDFAVKFLKKNNKEQPFFLYMPFTAPHNPLEAPDSVVAKYRNFYKNNTDLAKLAEDRVERLAKKIDIPDEKFKYIDFVKAKRDLYESDINAGVEIISTHAAMMHIFDENVGRVLKYLEESGELENTIVLYFSDNGAAPMMHCNVLNAPYKGRKTSLTEGGIKTPLIVYNEKLIPKNKINYSFVSVLDMFKSILSFSDIDYKYKEEIHEKFQGKDITDLILEGKEEKRYMLYWDLYGQQSVIYQQKWKWIRSKKGDNLLFDLENDPFEMKNIIKDYPKVYKKIRDEFEIFRKANNVAVNSSEVKKNIVKE